MTAEKYEDSCITVCVRARPLSKQELETSSTLAISFSGQNAVDLYVSGVPTNIASLTDNDRMNLRDFHRFNFDLAFNSSLTQGEVYEKVARPVVASSFKGFNNCIFAYGQTGSGKTYTMMGITDLSAERGIIPRLCEDLFKEVNFIKKRKEEKENRSSGEENGDEGSVDIAFYVSYLEIYMERIRCLLSSPKNSGSLKVRQHPTLGIYVEGLKEVPVASSEQLLALMNAGNAQRRTSKTAMNDTSSRSHAVFSIKVIQKNVMCEVNSTAVASEIGSKINLVDLAGSERAKSTKAEGELLKEGAQINKSLTTLGVVINALAELSKHKGKSNSFVPYRDSTLTFLLKESLGGNSKTLMMATVSPALRNASETLSTLRYADRAKAIVTRAFINETPQDKCIRELKEEVARLRDHIRSLEEKGNTSSSNHEKNQNVSLMKSELCRAEELIQQHTKTTKDREIEAHLALESIQQQTTLHVTRKEPYILNIDGAGDWVMQYFIVAETYLTSKSLVGAKPPSEVKKDDKKMFILVPQELSGGVGNPHCVFANQNSGSISLFSCCENGETYVNNQPLTHGQEYILESGDVISVGEELLQFRFMDPGAPIRTGRRRNILSSARDGPNRSTSHFDPKDNIDRSLDAELPLCDPNAIPFRRKRRSSAELPEFMSSLPFNSPRSRGRDSQRESSQRYSPRQATKTGDTESSVPPLSGRMPSSRPHLSPRNALSSRGLSPRKREKVAVDGKKSFSHHTFVFIGPSGVGKTSAIINIRQPRKHSFFHPFFRTSLSVTPTFGIYFSFWKKKDIMQMCFQELGGAACFSLLTDRLPVSQATFVLTFSLKADFRASLKFSLDTIAYQIFNRSISLILLGTFFEQTDYEVRNVFTEVEEMILQYFEALNAEIIPSIAGKFAIHNNIPRVRSFCFAKISDVFDLQQWFVDHAAHQSSLDGDYPNSLVPERCINLAGALTESRRAGFWYLPYKQYVEIASKITNDYAEDSNLLEKESKLLARWGVVFMFGKGKVVIDPEWAASLLGVLCLCRHFSFANSGVTVDVSPHQSEGLLVFSTLALRAFKKEDLNSQRILQADEYGLLTHGVMTDKVFQAIFGEYIVHWGKNYFENLTTFFQDSNWMFESRKLLFFNNSDQRPMNAEKERKLFSKDIFYLLPLCFFHLPSEAVGEYLPRFLLGPFFRFKFPILPPKFFSRLTCCLSSAVNAVYVGPYNLCEIPSGEAAVEVSCIPATPRFWSDAVWLVGPRSGRAFLCAKGGCIYASFHTIDAEDNPFVEEILKCISLLDIFDTSEWSVAVQPAELSGTTPLGAVEPENISYYILERKENYIFFLRHSSDEYVHPSQQLDDTLAFGEETVLSVTPFTRSMTDVVDLNSLEREILKENRADNRFSDILASWRDALSESSGQPELDNLAGYTLDTLVDALARLP